MDLWRWHAAFHGYTVCNGNLEGNDLDIAHFQNVTCVCIKEESLEVFERHCRNIVLIIDHCWSCRCNLIMPEDPFNFSTAQTSILMAYVTFLQSLQSRLNTTLVYNSTRYAVFHKFHGKLLQVGGLQLLSQAGKKQRAVGCHFWACLVLLLVACICNMSLLSYFESLRVIQLCFLNLAASCLVAQTFVVPQLGSLKPRELRVSSTASLLCPGPILEILFLKSGFDVQNFSLLIIIFWSWNTEHAWVIPSARQHFVCIPWLRPNHSKAAPKLPGFHWLVSAFLVPHQWAIACGWGL